MERIRVAYNYASKIRKRKDWLVTNKAMCPGMQGWRIKRLTLWVQIAGGRVKRLTLGVLMVGGRAKRFTLWILMAGGRVKRLTLWVLMAGWLAGRHSLTVNVNLQTANREKENDHLPKQGPQLGGNHCPCPNRCASLVPLGGCTCLCVP